MLLLLQLLCAGLCALQDISHPLTGVIKHQTCTIKPYLALKLAIYLDFPFLKNDVRLSNRKGGGREDDGREGDGDDDDLLKAHCVRNALYGIALIFDLSTSFIKMSNYYYYTQTHFIYFFFFNGQFGFFLCEFRN